MALPRPGKVKRPSRPVGTLPIPPTEDVIRTWMPEIGARDPLVTKPVIVCVPVGSGPATSCEPGQAAVGAAAFTGPARGDQATTATSPTATSVANSAWSVGRRRGFSTGTESLLGRQIR